MERNTITKNSEHQYDIAMSFAGEDRKLVEQVANYLDLFQVSVFYDFWEQHKLVGEDLYTYLAEVYEKRALYCAMFISHSYVTKAWPSHERKFAQSRAFSSKESYVLPIRVDDTECPGVPKTVGFIDARKTKPHEIAVILLRKLGKELFRGDDDRFMLKRHMEWRVLWDGTIKAKGNARMLYLGRDPKKRLTFTVWSPDDRPISLTDLSVRVGKKNLNTNISTGVKTSIDFNALLQPALKFGNIIDYTIRYRCPKYYADITSLCKDTFKAGSHMVKWEYKFIFPRNSLLKSLRLYRHVDSNSYPQAFDSSIEKGCPVVFYSLSKPKINSILEINFEVCRP